MENINLKCALYRLITDLIKADNIIAVDELDFLDRFCQEYGITEGDKLRGYQITMADAFNYLGGLPAAEKEGMLEKMRVSTESDGDECSRTESLLIQTALSIFAEKGAKVVSMPSSHLPIHGSQILYLENSDKGLANVVLGKDESFEELNNIARMGGFEIIYIPRIAKHYADYKNKNDIRRVISLVSPVHNSDQIDNTIRILQHMSTQYFYLNILRNKLGLPLEVRKPVWFIRIIDNVVDGEDYANFLCLDVKHNVKAQLRDFVRGVNSRMHEYNIMINERKDSDTDFLYSGFYKSILDVMAIKKVDRWELRIRTYGDGTNLFRDPETGKKTAVTIWKDGQEYPVFVSGRDAAFYTLLLCSSLSKDGGIDFNDRRIDGQVERRYEEIYQLLSRRSINGSTEFQKCPDVTAAQTRIPMKSRLTTAIRSSRLTEQSLYIPQEREKGVLYVPVEPEMVKVISVRGTEALADSSLYKLYRSIE